MGVSIKISPGTPLKSSAAPPSQVVAALFPLIDHFHGDLVRWRRVLEVSIGLWSLRGMPWSRNTADSLPRCTYRFIWCRESAYLITPYLGLLQFAGLVDDTKEDTLVLSWK